MQVLAFRAAFQPRSSESGRGFTISSLVTNTESARLLSAMADAEAEY